MGFSASSTALHSSTLMTFRALGPSALFSGTLGSVRACFADEVCCHLLAIVRVPVLGLLTGQRRRFARKRYELGCSPIYKQS